MGTCKAFVSKLILHVCIHKYLYWGKIVSVMLALLVVALLVLLLRLTLVSFVSWGCVCRLKTFRVGLTIWVVDSPDTGYFTLDVDEYECFTGELESLTDFDDKRDVKRDFLGLASIEEFTVGVFFVSGDFFEVDSTCQLTGLPFSPGWWGITKALVCLSSERSLHNADIKGRSIFRLFSRRVRMSNSPSAAALSAGTFFSSPDAFVTKGCWAGTLFLVGVTGGSFFFWMSTFLWKKEKNAQKLNICLSSLLVSILSVINQQQSKNIKHSLILIKL